MLMFSFPAWFLALQDTAQCLFKPSDKTVISQGSAYPLMTSYPLDLLLRYLTRKKVPPVPDPCKQGIDFHPIVAHCVTWWVNPGATTRAILAMHGRYGTPIRKSFIKYGVPRVSPIALMPTPWIMPDFTIHSQHPD